jgi:hypothetical protein
METEWKHVCPYETFEPVPPGSKWLYSEDTDDGLMHYYEVPGEYEPTPECDDDEIEQPASEGDE